MRLALQGAGALKAGLLAENKVKLRQAKQHARELSLTINTTKRQIDALKASEQPASPQQVRHAVRMPHHFQHTVCRRLVCPLMSIPHQQ